VGASHFGWSEPATGRQSRPLMCHPNVTRNRGEGMALAGLKTQMIPRRSVSLGLDRFGSERECGGAIDCVETAADP